MLSPGLVLASLLLIISAVWLAAGFLTARSDLDRGIGHGSAPAEDLAQASIGIQQIRGDAVLSAISRSGNASFADDFHANSARIGPGKGSLLDDAAAAQPATGDGAHLVSTVELVATAWYAGNDKVYSLATTADYPAEKTRVGASGVRYAELETDITAAINADQAFFTSAATAGAHTLDPLALAVIVAAAAMALGIGWGLSRRLAEYR
jgi:hypothetical protein